MKLSTGKVAFPIEFDNGDKAVIYLNPNDRGIQERVRGFEKAVGERIKKINFEKYKSRFGEDTSISIDFENPEKLLEMSSDELNDLYNKLDVVSDIEKEYNEAVKAELDAVFNSPISEAVFKYCQPFDNVIVEDENGNEAHEMYIMHFIKCFMEAMKKYASENKGATDKYVSKYTK